MTTSNNGQGNKPSQVHPQTPVDVGRTQIPETLPNRENGISVRRRRGSSDLDLYPQVKKKEKKGSRGMYEYRLRISK